MVKERTAGDTILYNTISKVIVELDNMEVLSAGCCVCYYENMCDENCKCIEGMTEGLYNILRGQNNEK